MTVEERQQPAGGRQTGSLANAVVLLCGTGHHERGSGLHDIPAVGTTLSALRDVLKARCGAGATTVVENPRNLSDLGRAISRAAERADDILVLY